MQDEAFVKRLQEIFAEEAKEHIEHLAEGLLNLKKGGKADALQALVEVLFREAHSLKGAARSVNVPEIEEVCKTIEGVFGVYKQSGERIPDPLIERMLESTDLLTRLAGEDETNRQSDKPGVQEMIGQIKAALDTAGKIGPEAAEKQAPEEPDADEPQPGAAETIPEETPPAMQKQASPPSMEKQTIRVSVRKLNAIMLQTEEMLFAKMVSKRHVHTLRSLLKEINAWARDLDAPGAGKKMPEKEIKSRIGRIESRILKEIKHSRDDERTVGLMVDRLLENLKQTLMLPFSELFYTLPKSVHDMAKSVGKEAVLEVVGGEIELDRRILEEMKDPLVHLMRNAVDHGIEMPEERIKKGKKGGGTVTLTLAQKSTSKVEIRVRDDGGGIDGGKLLDSAVKNGVIDREGAGRLDEASLLGLVFQSGISTSRIVTDLSGRGLGLAIVQEKAERLGGEVSVKNLAEGGCEFSILLPLTMATFRGVLALVAGQTFIFPSVHVKRVVEKDPGKIKNVEGKEMIVVDHRVVPYHNLGRILELAPSPEGPAGKSVVVIESGAEMLAFGVDAILYEEEVMVKSLGRQLSRVRNIAGATLLASDKPALILNVSDLFKTVGMVSAANRTPEKEEAARKRRILVVEDSPTTRALLKNIMEMAGYEVVTAVDGLNAYETLKNEAADLVVSDVDMPRMNGFELTESIRSDSRLADLPVVLVTSLESPEDRERGLKAGASAYIVKSTFDQNNLMEKIRWLID